MKKILIFKLIPKFEPKTLNLTLKNKENPLIHQNIIAGGMF